MIADARIATLRLALHRADAHMNRLVDELTTLAGTAFTSLTHGSLPTPASAGLEELRHPDAGELRLAFEMLTLPDADNQQLIVYLPADESTSARLDRLLRTGPRADPSLRHRAVSRPLTPGDQGCLTVTRGRGAPLGQVAYRVKRYRFPSRYCGWPRLVELGALNAFDLRPRSCRAGRPDPDRAALIRANAALAVTKAATLAALDLGSGKPDHAEILAAALRALKP